MPYIKFEDRAILEPDAFENYRDAETTGELNYQITCLLKAYIYNNLNYQAINDCLGALEGAKLEFYRRVAAPYENQKAHENGDVYDTTN